MKITSEKTVERYFINKVREAGWLEFKFLSAVNGVPDRLVVKNGRCVFAELKRPSGGTLSPAQRYVHDQLRAYGCEVYVLRNQEQVRDFVDSVLVSDGLRV